MQATSNSSPNSAQKLAWLLLHLLAQSSSGLGLAKPILSAQETLRSSSTTSHISSILGNTLVFTKIQ